MRLKLLAIMGILISPLVIYAIYHAYLYWPVVIEGVVDHKTVLGVRDGVVFEILKVAPHGVWFKDKEVISFLGNASLDPYNFTLDGLIEVIKSRYDEVYCTISIRTRYGDPVNGLKPGETLGYIADIEYFDLFKLGSKVKVAITRASRVKIVKIIEIIGVDHLYEERKSSHNNTTFRV
ncbi:MAG: hypothetical protein DRM97_01490 [Thermoprotei archaeon]|nr:MAG: hypothetical protein DRM97_01490 [Thermoprotei archaeon]